ncbi:hypothetical protein NPIL_213971 [Nephila pilipes]|uniref:Uncharacterized protein n=1 Tax=Nephila pilipes TaxID=299642 RepID=A0A8X6P6U6_NEPPI|nr:hypothetical protein NPIL_213971 [Nephila pilipes]
MPKRRGLHPLSSANVIQVDGNGLSADTESDEWARSNKPSCSMRFSLASNFGDIWRFAQLPKSNNIASASYQPSNSKQVLTIPAYNGSVVYTKHLTVPLRCLATSHHSK